MRGGIKTVLIPEENVKDLQDIPENVKNELEIVPVQWIDKVLEVALERQPTPLPDEEPAAAAAGGRRQQRRSPRSTATSAARTEARHVSPLSGRPKILRYNSRLRRGNSSVGRAQPCQG